MTYPIITRLGDKDAIHVCVQICKATESLNPGTTVAIVNGNASKYVGDLYDGVVNPFLSSPIKAGSLFYVFMRPDIPRSLTHHWEEIPTALETPTEDDFDDNECRNCY